MQAALAGTGVWLSDGATNVLPVGDRDTVHAAWRLQVRHVRHSLAGGFHQGWDLHESELRGASLAAEELQTPSFAAIVAGRSPTLPDVR
jgi:hypothetical protein